MSLDSLLDALDWLASPTELASNGELNVKFPNIGSQTSGKSTKLALGGDVENWRKDLTPNAMYWLVTNDYIANGGDQMNMLLSPVERIDTKIKNRIF